MCFNFFLGSGVGPISCQLFCQTLKCQSKFICRTVTQCFSLSPRLFLLVRRPLPSLCVLSPQHAKPFSSSDSLVKVQEVASWLLEMNQDLLSGGSSSRRRRGGPGGPAAQGNAPSAAQTPQAAAEEGDEDEHMNRVVVEEDEEQQQQHGVTPPLVVCF